MEPDEQEDDLLRKQGWYLGELSNEASKTVLETSGNCNVFVVHKSDNGEYVLSARFLVDGNDNGLIEHLCINRTTDTGMVLVEGQNGTSLVSLTSLCPWEQEGVVNETNWYMDTSHETIIDAVNNFVNDRDPPLMPALLGKKDIEAQMSIVSISAPPAYDQANRQLQPDIAPLPKIDNVNTEKPAEAKTGKISPSGSLQYNRYNSYDSYNWGGSPRAPDPTHMHNSHWWRYRDKSCCHPKNTCHCCFYRESYWNGYREVTEHSWYNCKGTGCCLCLLLSLMWCLCWPFVLIGFCCYGCIIMCFFCCCGYDDD